MTKMHGVNNVKFIRFVTLKSARYPVTNTLGVKYEIIKYIYIFFLEMQRQGGDDIKI
jgi:hypothetical protein